MAMTATERKRAQRARVQAAGSASAERVAHELVVRFGRELFHWCHDTSQPEPTITQVAAAVAEAFPADQRARVLLQLGYPEVHPEHVDEYLLPE